MAEKGNGRGNLLRYPGRKERVLGWQKEEGKEGKRILHESRMMIALGMYYVHIKDRYKKTHLVVRIIWQRSCLFYRYLFFLSCRHVL